MGARGTSGKLRETRTLVHFSNTEEEMRGLTKKSKELARRVLCKLSRPADGEDSRTAESGEKSERLVVPHVPIEIDENVDNCCARMRAAIDHAKQLLKIELASSVQLRDGNC
jgi:hypothetical protein